MEVRGYVYFKTVPLITSDTGQEGLTPEEEEWLECVSFLEDDLHWLLRLPHHRYKIFYVLGSLKKLIMLYK